MTNPMVPANVVLRDFEFMPLDVVRLRDSDLVTESSAEEFRAAVLLWCAAWHQAPAASLPDSDRSLAKLAGYGMDVDSWMRVRAGALRGFKLCDDGRLYHHLMAQKAIEAWEGKLRYRHKRECERIKKAAQRAQIDAVYPSFDEWKQHLELTGSDVWVSRGTRKGRPNAVPSKSHGKSTPKGRGRGTGRSKGQGQGEKSSSALDVSLKTNTHAVVEGESNEARACALMEQAGCKSTNPSHPELVAAIAAGVTPEALGNTAREGVKLERANPFAWACVTALKRHTKTTKPRAAAPAERSADEIRQAAERKAVKNNPLPACVTDLARAMRVGAATT